MMGWESSDELVYFIVVSDSGLDVVRASTECFGGVVVLWKQMIRCTRHLSITRLGLEGKAKVGVSSLSFIGVLKAVAHSLTSRIFISVNACRAGKLSTSGSIVPGYALILCKSFSISYNCVRNLRT